MIPEPIEASTETLRKERDRRAIKTGGVGVAVQALNHGIRLVVIPLSITMLGVEQYGLWLVVGSLVAWGGVTDLGLAPGLINVVASAQGRGDREGIRRAISTSFAAYGAIAVLIALLALVVSRWGGLPELLGARTPELAESGRMLVLVCGLIFAASTLTRVAGTTLIALQRGYLTSGAMFAGNLFSLGLLFLLVKTGGGLLGYTLAIGVPPLAAQLGLAVYAFEVEHRDLRPRVAKCDRRTLSTLWGFAGPLTVYQIGNVIALYSANILIASRFSAGGVPGYSVPNSAYAVMISSAWLAVSSYLPAYVEANARGDRSWIRKRSAGVILVSGALVCIGAAALVVIGPDLIRWWTGGAVLVGRPLLWAFMFFAVTRVVSNAIDNLMMGLGLVRLLARVSLGTSLLFVGITWAALPILGVVAVPLAFGLTSLLQILFTAPAAWRQGALQE